MPLFTALADPTRRSMIEMLARAGALSASEIAGQFSISAPAVSQHLKILRNAGLVSVEKRAQQRIYRVQGEGLKELQDWLERTRWFLDQQG